MNHKYLRHIVVIALVVVALVGLIGWLFFDPVSNFTASVPGQDNRPVAGADTNEAVRIGENFAAYNVVTPSLTGKWTNFRGGDFDNINKEGIPLIDKWGAAGPQIKWRVNLGEGHAAPSIYNGRVYIIDYDEVRRADALRCFSLETGQELWARWYRVHIKRNHGMSRTIPAVNDKYVVTIGPRCHVMCCNSQTGEYLWGIDLVKEHGTEVPFWYTGQCPFIADNVAVIAPGGTSMLIGVDCATGKVVWSTPNPDGWKMSHSSVMPMTIGGKKMYVYAAVGGIVGVSAEPNDIGRILWKTTEFAPTVVAPSPIHLGNGNVFMTAGYSAGGFLFNVSKQGDGYAVKTLKKYKPVKGIASEQQTPVIHDGHIFVILPKDAGGARNQFVCCKTDDVTNIVWTSGKDERFGLGPYTIADGKFFILNDDGELFIARATPRRFELLDRAKIIDGVDAWGPIAIADGYLLMRDSKQMVCIDMRRR
jgi:outer membrane protein assembly factor BamB